MVFGLLDFGVVGIALRAGSLNGLVGYTVVLCWDNGRIPTASYSGDQSLSTRKLGTSWISGFANPIFKLSPRHGLKKRVSINFRSFIVSAHIWQDQP
jgi:hypothetical protein